MEGASTLVGKVGNLGGQGSCRCQEMCDGTPSAGPTTASGSPQAQKWLDLRWGVWEESEQEAPQPRDLVPGRTQT